MQVKKRKGSMGKPGYGRGRRTGFLDAAVTAALEPHWRSVRTSARASAAGGQHQGPAGSAPTVRQSQIERESGHSQAPPAPRSRPRAGIASSSRLHDVATRATGSQIDSQRQSDAGGSSQPHAQSAARDMDANDYYLMDLNGFLHVK